MGVVMMNYSMMMKEVSMCRNRDNNSNIKWEMIEKCSSVRITVVVGHQ